MPSDSRLNLPFVGLVSFMRGPVCADLSRIDGDIAILGAPTDEGTPWAPGSRFAPRKIREMSVRYAGYGPTQKQAGYYDIETTGDTSSTSGSTTGSSTAVTPTSSTPTSSRPSRTSRAT